MQLNRLGTEVEPIVISQQADFRHNKSPTVLVVNLSQYIEEGFETGQIIEVALVDWTAAYDIAQHNVLLRKLYRSEGYLFLQTRLAHFNRIVEENVE